MCILLQFFRKEIVSLSWPKGPVVTRHPSRCIVGSSVSQQMSTVQTRSHRQLPAPHPPAWSPLKGTVSPVPTLESSAKDSDLHRPSPGSLLNQSPWLGTWPFRQLHRKLRCAGTRGLDVFEPGGILSLERKTAVAASNVGCVLDERDLLEKIEGLRGVQFWSLRHCGIGSVCSGHSQRECASSSRPQDFSATV